MINDNSPIEFTRVVTISDSSNIDVIKFDPNTNNMTVSFLTGATYLYNPVSSALFGTIVSADSVGSIFAASIRGNRKISFVEYTE